MTDDRHEEMAALYALGLLDAHERQDLERRLSSDPALRQLVDELVETSAAIALTAPAAAPSPSLKQRVLASIGAGEVADSSLLPLVSAPAAPTSEGTVVSFPFLRLIPWGIAAVLAICCAVLGQSFLAQRAELQARQAELAELRDRDVLAQMKIARLVSLVESAPQAVAVAVWDPQRQAGVLNVENLPPIPPDQDYQLWVIDPQYPIPVDGGVFHVDQDTDFVQFRFTADKPIAEVAKFAVSLERKGGVPKAEGPLVLLGP
jgi:anti-sigma-K factor RskA